MFQRLLAALLPRGPVAPDHGIGSDDWSDAIAPPLRALLLDALTAGATGRTKDRDSLFARARELDSAAAVDDSAAQHFYTRGRVHLGAGRIARARRCFELAHGLLPGTAEPLGMLGFCGYFDGDTIAARRDYDLALEMAGPGERGRLRINRLIDTLPQIASSGAQLQAQRAWFESEIDLLLADPPVIADPLQEIHRTVFYLGYQGLNDRTINAKLARLFLACTPSLGYVAQHAVVAAPGAAPAGRVSGASLSRARIGIVSMFLHKHSVGAWYSHLVRLLIESGRFDCTLFTYQDKVDGALREAAEQRGRHVFLGETLEAARAQIEAAHLDVLIYTDVAMHPYLYFLSFSRLAPLQALLVGHPGTSGVPAIDWFVSNVYQDTGAAQTHYTERLARLQQIPVWVQQSAPPVARLERAALGWDAGTRYYLCPMMLQKMHPDFDWALGSILRRDEEAEVVLFADREHPLWQMQLAQRFTAVMPDVAGRISFRRFAVREEFLNLLLDADCVLDPFHFSGGVTTYVALSLGVPVITLPGDLFRSRMTAGIYAQAGVPDCVARSREHYVDLALSYAADPVRRAATGRCLQAAHARLFATDTGVEVLAAWLDSVLNG